MSALRAFFAIKGPRRTALKITSKDNFFKVTKLIMTSNIQYEEYDNFKEFVRSNLSRKNRKIAIESFNDMAEATDTHLKIRVLNVTKGTGSLFDQVEKYKDGASLVVSEDLNTGKSKYTAYIPWGTKKKKKKHKHSHDDDDDDEPSTIMPMVYCMALCATLTMAAFTTTAEQWTTLYPF